MNTKHNISLEEGNVEKNCIAVSGSDIVSELPKIWKYEPKVLHAISVLQDVYVQAQTFVYNLLDHVKNVEYWGWRGLKEVSIIDLMRKKTSLAIIFERRSQFLELPVLFPAAKVINRVK